MLVIFQILCIFKNTVYSFILFLYFIPFVFCTLLTSVIVTSKGPSINYLRKIFRKTNISPPPLIRTRTCAYQGVRNGSFSESFAYILNEWPLTPDYPAEFLQYKHLDNANNGQECSGLSIIIFGHVQFFCSWDKWFFKNNTCRSGVFIVNFEHFSHLVLESFSLKVYNASRCFKILHV